MTKSNLSSTRMSFKRERLKPAPTDPNAAETVKKDENLDHDDIFA